MSWLDRVLNVFRPGKVSRDLDREISFHIDEAADRLVERGMDREAAMREATGKFGHRHTVKERTRDMDIAHWLETGLADLRQAFRGIRSSPGFAAVAVLSLALGIGANTAIFSLIDNVILKSLPVERPDQLVMVSMESERDIVFTNPLWEQLRDHDLGFNGSFAFSSERMNLAASGRARMADGVFVSGQFFSTLAVQPALGRLLQPADDQRGCGAIAVLSHGFWQSEFGGAADAIGRKLLLDRQPFTVVGVAAKGFTGVEVGTFPQVYVPLCTEPILHGAPGSLDGRSNWWLQVIGRVPEGVTTLQIKARLAAAAPGIYAATLPANWGEESKQSYLKRTFTIFPAANGISGVRVQYRTALGVLMAVVGVVLLIACANVANLLLARSAARQREIAMRLAIGASRGRIIRQVLTESLLISLLGAGLGLLFARWSTGLLVGLIATDRSPVALHLSLDQRLLGFTLLVSIGTGILFGVAPAWRSVRVDPQEVLKSGSSTGTMSALSGARVLVVLQVGLSLVLVASAGLLLGTFRSLAHSNPGFRPEGVVLASLDFASANLPEAARTPAVAQMLRQLRATPGVSGASASVITPVSGSGWNGFILVDGYEPKVKNDNLVWFNGVTDGYFGTLGTPILMGRDFSESDGPDAPKVALINRALAQRVFGKSNPIGRQFQVKNSDKPDPPVEIIGVVGDARYQSLRDTLAPTIYVPWGQSEGFDQAIFEVRTEGSLTDAVAWILGVAGAVAPNASLEIKTLSGQLESSLARERLLATLSGFFGGLALILALIGLYGTMAYNVTRRRKELGIRVALGATRTRLVGSVTGEAGRLILAGLVLGAAATFAATRLVSSFLFGRTALDPTTMAGSILVVACVALLAGMLPAWRAVRQDPQAVLREE